MREKTKIISDETAEQAQAANRLGSTKPKKKRRRLAYTKSDDAILAEFVRSHRTKSPGGNALWKLAENENLLPGRTWQSLKDHFLKYVQEEKTKAPCPVVLQRVALARLKEG